MRKRAGGGASQHCLQRAAWQILAGAAALIDKPLKSADYFANSESAIDL
jgi:hypothetical protein